MKKSEGNHYVVSTIVSFRDYLAVWRGNINNSVN